MNSFYIITNLVKDFEYSITNEIVKYLRDAGKKCCVESCRAQDKNNGDHYSDPSDVPSDCDCILVLGGDGTLIQAARDMLELQIPLFGINLGTLGYLTEVDRTTYLPALDSLVHDNYKIEHRMMLHGSVYRDGALLGRDVALNDIVITRESGGIKMMNLKNYVNGSLLNTYRADGVIISSPTGSTGYSMSAGGPIVAPEASLFVVTPLAAHALNTRSIILPSENKITIEIGPGRETLIDHASAYFDGDTKISMVTGDRIVIRKSSSDVLIAKTHNSSFLETLSKKMMD